jgi:hypothetical protein
MTGLFGLLLMLAVGSSGSADEIALPELRAWSERSHCPSMDMLNAASRHYHGLQLQSVFLDGYYAETRVAAGLPADVVRDDIQRLSPNRDFAACQQLNRWFEANVLYDAVRDEYLPYAYPMYYKVAGRYAILFLPYNAGRFEADIPPAPIPARTHVYVFDSSFGKIGEFGL